MNNEISNRITEKQAKALRSFGVTEAKIQALSKKQASELLTELIEHAKANPSEKPAGKPSEDGALAHAMANLSQATEIVMSRFGLRDESQLKEVHNKTLGVLPRSSRRLPVENRDLSPSSYTCTNHRSGCRALRCPYNRLSALHWNKPRIPRAFHQNR
jgi:hypothetical protein